MREVCYSACDSATSAALSAWVDVRNWCRSVREWCCGASALLTVVRSTHRHAALAYGTDYQWLVIVTQHELQNHFDNIEDACSQALAGAASEGEWKRGEWGCPAMSPIAPILGAMAVFSDREGGKSYSSMTKLIQQLSGPMSDFLPNLGVTIDALLCVSGVTVGDRAGGVVFFGSASNVRIDFENAHAVDISQVIQLLHAKKND